MRIDQWEWEGMGIMIVLPHTSTFSGVSPHGWCHPGAVPPTLPPPSDVTGFTLTMFLKDLFKQKSTVPLSERTVLYKPVDSFLSCFDAWRKTGGAI